MGRYDEQRDAARPYIEEYLASKGINARKEFRCLNPDHEDRHPSMALDKANCRVRCFSCGASYDILDLIGLDHGTDSYPEQVAIACSMYGIPLADSGEDRAEHRKKSEEPKAITQAVDDERAEKARKASYVISLARKQGLSDRAISYLQGRGISKATAERMGVCSLDGFFAGKEERWDALIIPTGEANLTARNMDELAAKDKRLQHRGEGILFNVEELARGGEDAVFVVEGEMDALSIIEAGGRAVALCSVSHSGKLIDALSGTVRVRVVLSLDNDEEGRRAQREIMDAAGGFSEGIEVIAYDVAGEGFKDPNEALVADREGFFARVEHGKALTRKMQLTEDYRSSHAASSLMLAFYDGISDCANTPAIPTGFKALDDILDGGLYEGLYCLPAISSLGKTTLALQIAEQVAASGTDVLFFSLEMSSFELMAKCISRNTLAIAAESKMPLSNAKTARGIMDGKRYPRYSDDENMLINMAFMRFEKAAKRLFIREGIGDIGVEQVRRSAEEHIGITGNRPLVIVDYLQILAPADPRATDKANMDRAALELKRMSRDLKVPVIAVSSVNRANYEERISLQAIKESGAIEYSSDVVLGLQLDGAGTVDKNKVKSWVDDSMSASPRKVELVVLKNRNGRRGDSVRLDYYAALNYMEERPAPSTMRSFEKKPAIV